MAEPRYHAFYENEGNDIYELLNRYVNKIGVMPRLECMVVTILISDRQNQYNIFLGSSS